LLNMNFTERLRRALSDWPAVDFDIDSRDGCDLPHSVPIYFTVF